MFDWITPQELTALWQVLVIEDAGHYAGHVHSICNTGIPRAEGSGIDAIQGRRPAQGASIGSHPNCM